MSKQPSRRDVLKAGAIGAAALATPVVMGQVRQDRPVRFAVIGIGGRGGANLDSAAKHGEVVALCDIDAQVRAKALERFPEAASFSDFRQMLDGMRDEIDAVVVSTPDHTHAVAAAMAMKLRKHVYCEKPLTRTIWEARRLIQLARESRMMTQMGNQGTAVDNLRHVAALMKAKTYGEVKEIHCWTDRAGGWWPQGVERPPSKPKPRHVDWDAWIGPSPWRDYADGYHPFAWRGWWDFGSGSLGDIGCHCMNLPFHAFDLRDPLWIEAETSGHNGDSFPVWSVVRYQFGARKGRPAVPLTWYDGGKMPPAELAPGTKLQPNGCLIVCERGTLHMPGEYAGSTEVVGGGTLPPIDYVKSPGHFTEWVESMKGGPKPLSNIVDASGPLTEMVLLGNLAIWATGDRLEWDARRMRVKNRPDLDPLIKPFQRTGWTF